MKRKKSKNNLLIVGLIVSAMIIVLLCYSLFFKEVEKDIKFVISDEKIDIKIGETQKINYELSDSNIIIEWTSSNDNIKVNELGEITASDYGESIITGIINDKEKKITNSVIVTPYTGDINIKLETINVPEGYIIMKPNSEFDLPFTLIPSNAYISSIKYSIDNQDVAIIDNNKIISKNIGTTNVRASFNNSIYIVMDLKVSSDVTENKVIEDIKSVSLSEENLIMEIGDTKTISYEITPNDGYLKDIEWASSNENIVTVNDGVIKAINTGKAVVSLIINNTIKKEVNITVKATNADIKIDYNPKTLIRIGESTIIKSHLEPSNLNDTITYKSSNPNIISVNNGLITGVTAGSSTITMSISNGKSKSFTIKVLPRTGNISGNNIWGYKSLNAKTPVLADRTFYQKLAQNGIGVFRNNTYIITDSGISYSYNIDDELLSVNNKKIKLRVYYPQEKDLSKTNTLVYMGGRGETNFGSLFNDIKNNPSLVKSSGIIALVAEGNNASFDGDSGAYTTKFLKAITKQKSGVKNSILGFSDGAHKVLHASNKEKYDRIVIFSGYTDYVESIENAKTSEVIFMIASSDGNYSQAKTTIRNMIKSGYKNVSIVSMGNDLSGFEKDILVINPGNLMKNGHYSINVLNSGIIEYLND